MKNAIYLLPAVLLQLFACGPGQPRQDSAAGSAGGIIPGSIDSSYVPTGFYFISDSLNGIRMHEQGTNDIYFLAKTAFASVANISKTEIKKNQSPNGEITTLCETFDSKGTRDLEEGTGNAMHPKIAAVVANKLLFVVNNATRISTGKMCLILDGFSEQEIANMQSAINQKR